MRPTERFSDRVADYVNFRPSYPQEIVDLLVSNCKLNDNSVISDIGSGTGKLTALLLQNGLSVQAVEPNKEMRIAAEVLLGKNKNFISVDGESDKTTLTNASVDLITVAQAFHWFDPATTKKEFARILKPEGYIAIIWNERNTSLPFQREYDQLLTELAPEYSKVHHRNITDDHLTDFFEPRLISTFSLPYSQKFNLPGFLGRMNSSSYTPAAGTSESQKLNQAATDLFNKHESNGEIEFTYKTTLHLG